MILSSFGSKINYQEAGSGPALLLVHGFLESASMWQYLVPVWADRFRVITVDLPGHGLSESLGEIHHMDDIATILIELLESLGIERVHLIGHSMGGYAALAFAELFPDRLRSICLLNSTSEADSDERLLNRERALNLVDRDHEAFIRLTIPALFSPENRKRFTPQIEKMQLEAFSFPKKGIAASIRGMMQRPDRTQVLSGLRIPKLIVGGKADPIIPEKNLKTIGRNSGSTFLSVPGGHMLHIENRNEILKIIHLIE